MPNCSEHCANTGKGDSLHANHLSQVMLDIPLVMGCGEKPVHKCIAHFSDTALIAKEKQLVAWSLAPENNHFTSLL